MVFMCEFGVKYCVSLALCFYGHTSRKRPEYALIGASALIRTNIVLFYHTRYLFFLHFEL